jgi:hypothetical protein
MIYVTGGGAWAKIDASEFLSGTVINTGPAEGFPFGWTSQSSSPTLHLPIWPGCLAQCLRPGLSLAPIFRLRPLLMDA